MKKETEGTNLVEQAVEDIFRGASQFTLYDPSLSHFSLRTLERQTQASRLRSNWRAAGVPVPPAMMMSITDRCNLRCQGCAAQAHQASPRVEMEDGKIRSIFVEARELGISIILLIGGEPLIRKEILNTTRDFAEIIFLLFSNGLLIDENLIVEFGEQNNIIPVLSLEGYQRETDGRRGKGVYQCLRRVMGRMEQGKIFWGVSFTLTRFNFDLVTDALFIKGLVAAGCRLFFFVEFNPMNGGLQDWILTKEQRGRVLPAVNWLESQFPGIFIAFPRSEERFGGCLAAGRGFVHISTNGNVEPCPFAPYSRSNLGELSLKEALQSDFLRDFRQNRLPSATENQGSCTFRKHRE